LSAILVAVTEEIPAGPAEREAGRPIRRFPKSRATPVERRRMREEVREVDFPIAIRGYERGAVDRYVEEVNRLIAELEISSSPESAIRHALDEVTEETSGLLQRAYETADEITARSRARADDRIQQAEQEAQELREAAAREAEDVRETAARETNDLRATAVHEAKELRETAAREAKELRETAAREAQELRATVQRQVTEMHEAAESRVRELSRDAEAIWQERRRMLDEMAALAREQLEIAKAASARLPEPPAGPETNGQATEPTEG
jgi:DivIVA domain-containing protein